MRRWQFLPGWRQRENRGASVALTSEQLASPVLRAGSWSCCRGPWRVPTLLRAALHLIRRPWRTENYDTGVGISHVVSAFGVTFNFTFDLLIGEEAGKE